MTEQTQDSKPWWREPWPWILMAGPALAIIGCIITIVLALDGYSAETVNHDGVKRGLVVTKVPAADAASIPESDSVE